MKVHCFRTLNKYSQNKPFLIGRLTWSTRRWGEKGLTERTAASLHLWLLRISYLCFPKPPEMAKRYCFVQTLYTPSQRWGNHFSGLLMWICWYIWSVIVSQRGRETTNSFFCRGWKMLLFHLCKYAGLTLSNTWIPVHTLSISPADPAIKTAGKKLASFPVYFIQT